MTVPMLAQYPANKPTIYVKNVPKKLLEMLVYLVGLLGWIVLLLHWALLGLSNDLYSAMLTAVCHLRRTRRRERERGSEREYETGEEYEIEEQQSILVFQLIRQYIQILII